MSMRKIGLVVMAASGLVWLLGLGCASAPEQSNYKTGVLERFCQSVGDASVQPEGEKAPSESRK